MTVRKSLVSISRNETLFSTIAKYYCINTTLVTSSFITSYPEIHIDQKHKYETRLTL